MLVCDYVICAAHPAVPVLSTMRHLQELLVSVDVTLKFALPGETFTMINTLVYLKGQVHQVTIV